MSGKTYWLSVVAVIGFSSAFWWLVLFWLGVSDPIPAVAILDAVVLTGYLFVLRCFLKDDTAAKPSVSRG